MPDIWTIQAALDWTRGYLERHDDAHPRLSAEWLISFATGLSRVELYAYFDRPLSMEERDVLRDGVRRRGQGEPLQYVVGEVAFRHIVVKTRDKVLIPRPETEVLVQEALDFFSDRGSESADARPAALTALDLCTGTGCIALSLAHENPAMRVVATDIDPAAVELARENAIALGLDDRVEVFECDLAQGVSRQLAGTFDLVISNPPYIPTEELSALPHEIVDFESRLALDGGSDGLSVFRRIVDVASRMLRQGGLFAVELHESCLNDAASLCEDFEGVRIVRDLAGRDRVLLARMP